MGCGDVPLRLPDIAALSTEEVGCELGKERSGTTEAVGGGSGQHVQIADYPTRGHWLIEDPAPTPAAKARRLVSA